MQRIISFILISILLFSFPFSSAAATGAFLVMDGRTKSVLEESNGTAKLPMASTTKVMTAMVVLEQVGLEEIIEIPQQVVGVEGTSLYLKKGERYTVKE